MTKVRVVLIALCACGDDGGDGTQTDAKVADAKILDAAVDAPVFDCATSPATGTHKIYLAFEGVTLTKGSPSDATTNTVPFIFEPNTMSGTIAQWRASAGDRQMQIDTVVCAMRSSYFLFDVEFTTTRPASGDYEMVVFGGKPSDLAINQTLTAITQTPDCGTPNMKNVVWVTEYPDGGTVAQPTIESAVRAAGFIAVGGAVSASKSPGNCTCSAPSSDPAACDYSKACTFSDASPIPNGGALCNATSPENQIMKLTTRYGARTQF